MSVAIKYLSTMRRRAKEALVRTVDEEDRFGLRKSKDEKLKDLVVTGTNQNQV